ncbi:TauD/TfdA family dioxygenase [Georgenia muralis]|uniref:TauD/TfdA family dioxygenase n=1 Tax=Georgenia muralis TaxID=154117 RepID=UPI000F517844|nr:TauD/TfdA family dioxygenase [Georgenia muralis]
MPTLFWPYNSVEVNAQVGDALQEGLFTLVSGPKSFLAPARSVTVLRFDAACMRPSDSRAMTAAEFLSTRKSTALEHMWDEPNTFMLLDNHRVLHARGDASAEPDRLLYRIGFDVPKAAKR